MPCADMQKCYAGDFLKTWSCSQSRLNMYEQKLRLNLDLAEMYHKKCVIAEPRRRFCTYVIHRSHAVVALFLQSLHFPADKANYDT